MVFAMEELAGTIENIVFTSEESGFTVARLKIPRQQDTRLIVGSMPGVQPGETITCKGSWKRHPQYGSQFEVCSFEIRAPTDIAGIQKYLESGLIKGIGPVYAAKIVEQFGINTLEIIDHYPQSLLKIQGIGQKRIDIITKHWNDQKSIRDVMIFLRSHGVKPSLAQKIYKAYGDQSIEKVQENPYELAKHLFGVGFKSADKIAQNLGIAKDSPVRVDAGIEHVLWELSNQGHVCHPKNELILAVEKTLEVSQELIEERLSALVLEKRIIEECFEEPFIWIKPLYLFEKGIIREICRILSHQTALRSIDAHKALDWVQRKLFLQFASGQRLAIMQSFIDKMHIITGGPGTGKSTITNAILSIAEKLTDRILLAAPTGRAAKRLSEITRRKASTIHSLLEFDFTHGGFKKNGKDPLACDLIILDEVSMIDTQLMYHLLKAIPSHCKVILIGDVDQLPSVGPGNVLKDLIESQTLGVTRLTEIFRQAGNSQIVVNAHKVNKGIFPDLSWKEQSDFYFYPLEDPQRILGELIYQVTEVIPNKYSLDIIRDIQVLAPMKRGILGTENLNDQLQQKINPSANPLSLMGRNFHENDKVMQLRNNYHKGVYNGDVGTITQICREEKQLSVLYDVGEVLYDFTEIDELTLAYAASVHKYQGSECPCIVMPIHTGHYMLLFKNLLYTAMTRGKKYVILIGMKRAIAMAIHKDDAIKRYTGLLHFLREEVKKSPYREQLR